MNPRAVDLPQAERHPARPRHRRQRAEHGLRQHGRHLGHRRRLHAQPVHGRARSSTASSCRTRRARTWWRASARRGPIAELEKVMPKAYAQLREITTRLEKHYKDVQDFEFTIQENTLYMLQTRNGKRTGAGRGAHRGGHGGGGHPHAEGGGGEGRAAVARPAPAPDLRPARSARKAAVAAKGLPASPGAATGAVVFTADDAVAWSQQGQARGARAHGDGARRHPRHERGPGHPHRHRRA